LFLVLILLTTNTIHSQNGDVKKYLATTEKPANFRIYGPAEVKLRLNYTKRNDKFSAYNIYKNDQQIYSTIQGQNNFLPPKVDTAELARGLYSFEVGTMKLLNENNQYNYINKDSELEIEVQCISGNCFIDPMVLLQQQQQRQQTQRNIQKQQQQKTMQNQTMPNLNNNMNQQPNHMFNLQPNMPNSMNMNGM
jgi:hypothetical protein